MSKKIPKKTSFVSRNKKSFIEDESKVRDTSSPISTKLKASMAIRSDSLGYNPSGHHDHSVKIESLVYQTEESDVFKAYAASQHYRSRGKFWNDGKREIMIRYINLSLVGLVQGCIAYFANIASRSLIEVSEFVYTVIASCIYFIS